MLKRIKEKGSVFTVLLAGVALAATLSVVLYQVISGPMASVVRVSNKTAAKNQLQSVGSIIIMDAINGATGGDCDNDGSVEPKAWKDKGTSNAPVGGGLLPPNIGAPMSDPWGSDYGYCVWDTGTDNVPSIDGSCDIEGVNNRLSGTPDPAVGEAQSQTVLAVISAGPDRIFATECRPYVDTTTAVLIVDGDDVVQQYTYNEASTAISSLWKISTANSDVAVIDKNITVGTPETNDNLLDTSGVIRAFALVTEGLIKAGGAIQAGGAVRLADQNIVNYECVDNSNIGDMRYNTDEQTLQVCNGSEWEDAGGGAKLKDAEKGSIPFVGDEGDLIEDDGTPPALSFDTATDNLRVGRKISFVSVEDAPAPQGVMPNAFTLDYMDDVEVNGATNDQMLVYNAATNLWINQNQRWSLNGANIYYNGGNVGIGTNDPTAGKLHVIGTIYSTGHNFIANASPTTYYLDSDNRSAMIHVNSNLFYILRGNANGSSTWATYNGYWPLSINLENNDATFGGNISAPAGRITDKSGYVSPVGSMTMFAGGTAPAGWLLCNGAAVSTATYPDLFAVIGYTYGGSGGTFFLPDMQGAVPRGAGTSTGYAQNITRALGTKQDDALQNITGDLFGVGGTAARAYPWGFLPGTYGAFSVAHTLSTYNRYGGDYAAASGNQASFDASRVARTSNETRMKNVGVNFIIKY